MKRVIIIGCGGAGKSTLARKLGDLTGIPVIHLDKLFWKPGWVERTPEEFDPIIRAEIEKDEWIMDGNFNRTMPQRVRHCDTVIYLDFSRTACLLGVLKRVLTTYGTVRPDMGEGCPERVDIEFLLVCDCNLSVLVEEMNLRSLDRNLDCVANLCCCARSNTSDEVLTLCLEVEVCLVTHKLNNINLSFEDSLRILVDEDFLIVDSFRTHTNDNFLTDVSHNLRLSALGIGKSNL